jgi:hypothetical protein
MVVPFESIRGKEEGGEGGVSLSHTVYDGPRLVLILRQLIPTSGQWVS